MHAPLAVGFGFVSILKDDEVIWSGDDLSRRAVRAENMARKDPDHDWRIQFYGPLSEAVYQRHERNEWYLVERGLGFA